MRDKKEYETMAFAFICNILEKSTIFHSMGASEIIGQLNAMYINHMAYVSQQTTLIDSDKTALIDEATHLTLDSINCISILSEIYSEIEKYKIRIKK